MTTINGMDFWYRSDDKFIGQRIALGKYEEYETKLLLGQLKPAGIAVDVGANIGYYTLLMAKRCKKVYAIEPEPINFGVLKKNVEMNDLKNVILINKAAGERDETIWLKKSKINFGDHRLVDKNCHTAYTPRNEELTKVITLDNLLKDEPRIDLIKSDTQGWEPAVIKGTMRILKRDCPTIFLEYWPDGASEAKQDLKKMIHELKKIYGKNIFEIDGDLNIYRKIGKSIRINPNMGYTDIWMKRKPSINDLVRQLTNLRIKKLIRSIIGM